MQDFGGEGKARRTSRFGEPEFYYVNSMYGSFKVHESRCLVFKNGVLPEQISNSTYQMWGMPEYVRIKRALRETTTAHSDSVRLLERSVQAIYKMKNLSQLLATDDGENQVLRRLEVIDMAKGLLNSIAIDSEGEDYDFKTFQFSGVKDVIDSTCNMLSALTNIPQTLLFGRSPSGMNATGDSDLENYYNYVERIQKLMLKKNLRYLLDIIFRAGVASSELAEEPDYKLEFKPLWSMSESEQAAIDQQKAATSLTKAQTTQIYVDMGALDPTEVRSKLASNDEYTVEDIIEDDDEDIFSSVFGATEGQIESEAEAVEKNTNQTAQQTPMQEPITEPIAQQGDAAPSDVDWITTENGTHIPIGAGGEAVGGPLKGENFSQAKSEPSGEKAEKKLTKSSASEMRSKMMGCSEEEAAKKAGEATEGYTGSIAAMNLNKELRKANPNLDDWQKERVQMLDGAMSDLPQDVSLVRGAMKPYAKETLGLKGTETEKQLTKKLVGKEFTEQAYMSTSYDEKANRNSWNDVIMNITAKAGTKALVTTNDEESEVILGRGTRYKVTGVHAQEGGVNGSQIVLDVETLPSSSGSNSDSNETPNCVGVLVIKDGRVLTGVRKSASHPFEICGPGGHIEPGETPEQAAIRETEEEFGITPKDLTPVSVRTGLAKEFGIPAYFVCTEYDGDVRCYDHSEMVAPQWSDLGAVIQSVEAKQDNLFPPFADSIRVLNDVLKAENEKISQEGLPNSEKSNIISMEDGGPGSGRYPKGSGESESSGKGKTTYTNEDYDKALKGVKTSTGATVKSIDPHLYKRAKERNVYPSSISAALTKGTASPGNVPNSTVFRHRGTKVVFMNDSQLVKTVIYEGQKAKKGG
jgi:8-oxo-dGTP pyrophosphatase MutT (NUDIX family)